MKAYWKILVLLVLVVLVAGCQDRSQQYVIVHQDGRVWKIEHEPAVFGGLWSRECYGFVNAGGFKCGVATGNSRVLPASEFDFDLDKHRYTYEHVWEKDQ